MNRFLRKFQRMFLELGDGQYCIFRLKNNIPLPDATLKPVPLPEATLKTIPLPEATLKIIPLPETTLKIIFFHKYHRLISESIMNYIYTQFSGISFLIREWRICKNVKTCYHRFWHVTTSFGSYQLLPPYLKLHDISGNYSEWMPTKLWEISLLIMWQEFSTNLTIIVSVF